MRKETERKISACIRGTGRGIIRLALVLSVVAAVMPGRSLAGERPKVVFGSDYDYPPYESLDENSTPHGLNIELIKAIGEVSGFDVDITLSTWTTIRQGLEVKGVIDISDMYYSDERAKVVDFCDPTAIVYDEIWVRAPDPPIRTPEGLRGKQVIVQRGGYQDDFVSTNRLGAVALRVDSEPEALRMLASGRGDCAIVSQIAVNGVRDRTTLANIMSSSPPFNPRAYGFVVHKDNHQLREMINIGLAQLRASGQFAKIRDKWFSTLGETSQIQYFLTKSWPYLAIGFIALLVWIVGWTLLLRRRVFIQTAKVQDELAERKRIENDLRLSEDKFARAFHHGPVLMGFSDVDDGRFFDVNRSFCDVLGFSREEILGHSSAELGLWLDEGARMAFLEVMTTKGRVDGLEILLRRKGGDFIDALFSADIVEVAGKKVVLSAATDISALKKAERELRNSEQRWKFALEGAGDGVWDWNIKTNEIFLSRRYKEMLGYTDGEFDSTVKNWRAHLHPEEINRIHVFAKEQVRLKIPHFEIELRMRHKDGHYKSILARGKVIAWNVDGSPLRMIGTHTDVTEKRRAEIERVELEEQLRQSQKMEAVGRLAGGIAHDFNNQLTVIHGYCDILAGHEKAVGCMSIIDEIRRATRRSMALTNQLLAFSRKQIVKPTIQNINNILNEMSAPLARIIGEDVHLVTDLDPDLGNVEIDAILMEQAVLNLCVNARDAMQNGGTLTITTKSVTVNDEFAKKHMGLAHGRYVRTSVRDTGTGIDDETAAHIFEPFFTTKEQGKGTGLGLALVYGSITQAGGMITVESAPNIGSEFNIFLPQVEGEVAQTQQVVAQKIQRAPQNTTILFVEDDSSLFYLLRDILISAGYETLAANTPEKALELARENLNRIDLIVSDVVMPGMSGPEMVAKLRRDRPDLRTLFISGYPLDNIAQKDFTEGDIDLLSKPFTPSELLERLRLMVKLSPSNT